MRHRRTIAFLFVLALGASLASALCASPAFAEAWSARVSIPALRALSSLSMPLPFSLLEWGLAALAALWTLSLLINLRRSAARAILSFLRRAAGLLTAAALAFIALWLPLYHASAAPAFTANADQLAASCEALIAQLNECAADFDRLPADLPAKPAAFPFWMDACNIVGFFSFPTGEALYAPDLPACAVPFVAVHERMHALGHAGEGEANIAAWNECVRRGGGYADSARLWALKYSMGLLVETDYAAYARCRNLMNPRVYQAYRSIGGGGRTHPERGAAQALFAALGVGDAANDYEILAHYLASRMPV